MIPTPCPTIRRHSEVPKRSRIPPPRHSEAICRCHLGIVTVMVDFTQTSRHQQTSHYPHLMAIIIRMIQHQLSRELVFLLLVSIQMKLTQWARSSTVRIEDL